MPPEQPRYFIEQAQTADTTRYDNEQNAVPPVWEERCIGDTPGQVLEQLLTLLNGDEIVVTDSWLRLRIVRKNGENEIRNY